MNKSAHYEFNQNTFESIVLAILNEDEEEILKLFSPLIKKYAAYAPLNEREELANLLSFKVLRHAQKVRPKFLDVIQQQMRAKEES